MTKKPVFTTKVGENKFVQSLDIEQQVINAIVNKYFSTLSFEEKVIDTTFVQIYGKKMRFSQCVSELYIKIKNIMQATGKSIEEMVEAIHKSLGYKCSFYRYVGEKLIPITSDRIIKAYDLATKGNGMIQVENALYF